MRVALVSFPINFTLLIIPVLLCYLLISMSLSSSVKPLKASLVGTNRVHCPGRDRTSSKSAAFTRLRKMLFTTNRQTTNTFSWNVVTIIGSRYLFLPFFFFLMVFQFSNTHCFPEIKTVEEENEKKRIGKDSLKSSRQRKNYLTKICWQPGWEQDSSN